MLKESMNMGQTNVEMRVNNHIRNQESGQNQYDYVMIIGINEVQNKHNQFHSRQQFSKQESREEIALIWRNHTNYLATDGNEMGKRFEKDTSLL